MHGGATGYHGEEHGRWLSQRRGEGARAGSQSGDWAIRENRYDERPHCRSQEIGWAVQGNHRAEAVRYQEVRVALVFSPLSEELLQLPPAALFPRHAFLMRQLGNTPALDRDIADIVTETCNERGFQVKDASTSTGSKDFLERILGLIRGTGLTVAIFSHETRPTALANIALELGFAAMCGKPLIIVKSKEATAPSDLTRTDWIEYAPDDKGAFRAKIGQALQQVDEVAEYQEMLLDIALEAPLPDCAVAFERANKAFLLSGNAGLLDKAEIIRGRLAQARDNPHLTDLGRLHDEVAAFIKQGRKKAQPAN